MAERSGFVGSYPGVDVAAPLARANPAALGAFESGAASDGWGSASRDRGQWPLGISVVAIGCRAHLCGVSLFGFLLLRSGL